MHVIYIVVPSKNGYKTILATKLYIMLRTRQQNEKFSDKNRKIGGNGGNRRKTDLKAFFR